MLKMMCAVGAIALLSVTAFAAPVFTTFDPPGAVETQPTGINAAGTITGFFSDTKLQDHGFVRTADGTIVTFDVPSAVLGPKYQGTIPMSINDQGTVTGVYYGNFGLTHGFIRTADGTITTFSPVGVVSPSSINDAGVIVGYSRKGSKTSNQAEAFERLLSGQIVHFAITPYTAALQINKSRSILGYYRDSSQSQYSFIRSKDGTITVITIPNTIEVDGDAINDAGTVAGNYLAKGHLYGLGFVRTPDGLITKFDPVGSVFTQPNTINDAGRIAGFYMDRGGVYHGFVRAAGGAISSFDGPGATVTAPYAINSFGVITGQYGVIEDNVRHGFIRSAP